MRGATFDPREVEAERHVIAEERARDLDSPARPARPDPPGRRLPAPPLPQPDPRLARRPGADRPSTTSAAFYRRHYRPDGAVLVVVGDVDPEPRPRPGRGALRRRSPPGASPGPSPPSTSRGRRAGATSRWSSPSRSPAASSAGTPCPRGHPDGPALDVLSDLLTCGRRSRLWDALVERERLATWVEAGAGRGAAGRAVPAPGRGRPGRRPRADRAGDRRRDRPSSPTRARPPEELARSRNRLEAAWRWEQEDLAGLAAGLGHVALWGDWRAWQAEHRAALAVEADDIRRVASTYLADASLTVGWSLPRPGRAVTVLLPGRGPAPDGAAPAAAAEPPSGRSRSTIPRGGSRSWPTTSPRRDGPAQRHAARHRAPARDGDRGAGAVRRRRPAPRGEAGPGLPDRPAARGGDADAAGRGAGRGDRGRRRHARRRLDRAPRSGSAPRTCRWPSSSLADVRSAGPPSRPRRCPGPGGGSRPSCRATATTRPSAPTCSSAAWSTATIPTPATRAARSATSPG